MPEEISPEVFNHLVELAALELDPQEAEYLRRELNNQLKAIDELAAIPIPEGTQMATHGVGYSPYTRPPMRVDQSMNSGASTEILAQVPVTDEQYVIVPEIPHEELE